MHQFHASVRFSSGEIIAMSDVYSGCILRCFQESYPLGEIVRGTPWNIKDGLDLVQCSRIMGIATSEEIRHMVTGIKRDGFFAGRRIPPLESGTWYRVLED